MTNTIGVTFDGGLPLPGQKLLPTGHDLLVIATPDDLDQFVAGLIEDYGSHAAYARLLDTPVDEDTGLPPQSLMFAVNRNGKVGSLKYYDEDTIWYAAGDAADDEVSYTIFGNPVPWPPDSEIPLDHVKAAVNHFREHARDRWHGVKWTAWPEEVPI
ncbi:Imm1 family immunity protein [Kribbella catacumbae]|uniref:Imm1 family immunity protein n=1 Tax=Kribbella catacumbae TaxID=460086 RepID=UPI00037FE4AD|nr:Imm1 family immunity protein [Kribbella catacumbae]